jgi:DNA topoisomerase-1
MSVHEQDVVSARAAGLHYVTDGVPGLRREARGPGFRYVDAQGRRVNDATRRRILALVIPPAWTGVWIAADPLAHLQVTGHDARGRKQYRYHPEWSAARDAAKYDRLRAFARALPAIRRHVAADLRSRPLSRPWVVATVMQLLESTVIRVGNAEYSRTNGSYGLTTLQNRHVHVDGSAITLKFRAKSGVEQEFTLVDATLAKRLAACKALPGRRLFQYLDERGRRHAISAADVNAYVHEAAGSQFSAKDFRTWAGTLEAARALDAAERRQPVTITARKRELLQALDEVAAKLGNTRAVCRKCYVHPAILEQYFEGRTLSDAHVHPTTAAGLSPDERALVLMLQEFSRTKKRAS